MTKSTNNPTNLKVIRTITVNVSETNNTNKVKEDQTSITLHILNSLQTIEVIVIWQNTDNKIYACLILQTVLKSII